MSDKKADLAGPGISTYEEVAKILPQDYNSLLTPKEILLQQLELSGQMDLVDQPYHQAIINDVIPLGIGGGIGQSRVYMLLLRKAHLGEVGVTIWPQQLRDICAERNIHVLQ